MPEPLPGPWPRRPLIYQVYPRSFQDSDGDGIGDLRGILQRLDHIAALSVDAIWICPFTRSPWVDGGYDVQDYTAIDPRLGDDKIWRELVNACHDRGIRVIVDLVLNHTSDQHSWFKRSVAREPDFDTRYVWRDARPDGSPPTNWQSRFGMAAWSWHHKRQQYYLHNYLPDQPGLNLRCEHVQAALQGVFRHWSKTGVDGFRLDAVTSYLCDPEFRDNPPADAAEQARMDGEAFLPYARQDHQYDFLPGDGCAYAENLRDWAGPQTYLFGEVATGNKSVEISNELSRPGRLNAGYVVDVPQYGLTAEVIADVMTRCDDPSTCAWWTRSHDRPRLPATGDYRAEAGLEIMLLAFLPGPALVYQGQELGLHQPHLDFQELTDPYERRYWPDGPGREAARVPIPWTADEDANFGFSNGDAPWLPMRWDGAQSAAVQRCQDDSVLSLTQNAFRLRRDTGLNGDAAQDWDRDGHLLRVRYPDQGLLAMFNLGLDAVPSGTTISPQLTSQPKALEDGMISGRSAAIWVDMTLS